MQTRESQLMVGNVGILLWIMEDSEEEFDKASCQMQTLEKMLNGTASSEDAAAFAIALNGHTLDESLGRKAGPKPCGCKDAK